MSDNNPTNDKLWQEANDNTALRTKAMALSKEYHWLIRHLRVIADLEQDNAKSPQAALNALSETIPAFVKRVDAIDKWIKQAEQEYEVIMRKLDYEDIRG